MKSLLSILLISFGLNGVAQFTDIPKPWIDVSERTDSLVAALAEKGIDSIISYYRSRYPYDYYHPENKTNDDISTVTVWKQNGAIHFKKITEFYESETELRDFQVIFDFYSYNKSEIDTTLIRLSDSIFSGPTRTHDRGFSLYYKMGSMERNMSWGEIDLEFHESYPTDYLVSLSSRLYTWTKMLEHEIMFMDINEIWIPTSLKPYTEDEEREVVKGWIEMTELEIERLRKKYNINKDGK